MHLPAAQFITELFLATGDTLLGPLSGLPLTRATCHCGAPLIICPSVILFVFSEIIQLYDPIPHYLGIDLKRSDYGLWGEGCFSPYVSMGH